MMNRFFVFDTSCLVSAALLSDSVSRKALEKAVFAGELAMSVKTTEEFIEVLYRKKFDRYFFHDNER